MSLDGFVQLIFNVYEAFTVALFVRDGKSLSCFSAITFAKSFDRARLLPIDATLPGWALKHNEPLIIGNFDKDEETLGYYGQREEIKSFMAYPLDIPGVIVVDSKKKWVFTDKEKKMLAHFGAVVTKELEREKRLQEMEEEHEELLVSRRIIGLLRDTRPGVSVLDEVLKEGMALSGADLAVTGIEKKGRLSLVGSAGAGAEQLLGSDCPATGTIAATVMESAREFVLPYESGYLRERPLLFQNDGVKAKQYFGFPLMSDDRPYGFVGFASLSARRLREGSISMLRDIAVLLSLYLSRLKTRQEMEYLETRDQVTGAFRLAAFFERVNQAVSKRASFSLISIKLPDFGVYNRSLGIARADSLLKGVYQAIEYCAGKNAIVARAGGAHFYLILKGSDPSEGENIVRVLKLTILTHLSREGGIQKNVIQAGTAYFPGDGKTAWELVDTAEKRGRENVV